MAKKTRIFNDAEDKNVAATIVYPAAGSEGLYWDEEGENPVYADEALRLVATGAMVFGVASGVSTYGKLITCIISDEETMVDAYVGSSSPVEFMLPNRPAEEDEEDEGGEDEGDSNLTPPPSQDETNAFEGGL